MLRESTSCSERTVTVADRSPDASRSAACEMPPMYCTIPRNAVPSAPISSVLLTTISCSIRPLAISVAAFDSDCTAPMTLRSVAIAITPIASSDNSSTAAVTLSIVVCSEFAVANDIAMACCCVRVSPPSSFDTVAKRSRIPCIVPISPSAEPRIMRMLPDRA